MDEPAQRDLTQRFEAHRPHLRAVAYRLLGSLHEADDAVQEAWLRLHRSDSDAVGNLAGWLTTVVARIALDMLRSRASRREQPLDVLPDPVVTAVGTDPESSAVLADTVSLALLVVLQTLSPAERLVFVLHDLFAVPFDEIAPVVGRTPAAARQLASRARRRVRSAGPAADPDPARVRPVVEAWLAASRRGDFAALLALLAPDAVLRVDAGPGGGSRVVRGDAQVAGQAVLAAAAAVHSRIVLVNGVPGIVAAPAGQVAAVLAFTVDDGRVTRLDILADRARLRVWDGSLG